MADQVTLHPLCSAFPAMDGAEYADFAADIAAHGCREPIVMLGGQVLEGQNRARACADAGLTPPTREFGSLATDGDDPAAFVLSANLHRRHLSAGQRAAIVANITDWSTAQAHGGVRAGVARLPLATIAGRAGTAGVSERTQRMADDVAKADPGLAKEVAQGKVTLPNAVRKVKPAPAADQVATLPLAQDGEAQDLPDGDDLLKDLDELRSRNAQLEAAQAAIESADPKAEIVKAHRLVTNASSERDAAMDRAAQAAKRVEFYQRQLLRCGRAVGVTDLDAIAAAVEAFVRQHKKAVA